MKNKSDISNRLLDSLLKEAMKKDYISVEKYLIENGYDKRMAKGIRNKLINDGNAVLVNDDEYSMRISTNGFLIYKRWWIYHEEYKRIHPTNNSFDRMYNRFN